MCRRIRLTWCTSITRLARYTTVRPFIKQAIRPPIRLGQSALCLSVCCQIDILCGRDELICVHHRVASERILRKCNNSPVSLCGVCVHACTHACVRAPVLEYGHTLPAHEMDSGNSTCRYSPGSSNLSIRPGTRISGQTALDMPWLTRYTGTWRLAKFWASFTAVMLISVEAA